MYEVLDKDTIKSEILPHLSVAKHGCLDENVPPALRIHERWGMVANRNTTLSILLYKINSSYVLLTATACFLFSLLSFFFYRLSNLSCSPINTFSVYQQSL